MLLLLDPGEKNWKLMWTEKKITKKMVYEHINNKEKEPWGGSEVECLLYVLSEPRCLEGVMVTAVLLPTAVLLRSGTNGLHPCPPARFRADGGTCATAHQNRHQTSPKSPNISQNSRRSSAILRTWYIYNTNSKCEHLHTSRLRDDLRYSSGPSCWRIYTAATA